jgi:UDP-N-acetylglucosamine 3-dehydrogenase
MNEVRVACFGNDGHQIVGKVPSLSRARLVAAGGMGKNADKIKQQFPDVPYYDDFEKLLAENEVDLVCLCWYPRDEQFRWTLDCLNKGINVLADKPMAQTMEELETLRKTVKSSGKLLRTITHMPYMPPFYGMSRVVASGQLGEIVHIYCLKSYPYFDNRPQIRSIDGGLIQQAGIHAVSLIRFFTGLEPTEVYAQDTKLGNPKEGELQMAASFTMKLNNGGIATILCNYLNHPEIGFRGNDQLRLHGTKGMAEIVDGRNRRLMVVKGGEPAQFEDATHDPDYPQDVINAILDGTPTMLTEEDAFRNTEIVIRAQESADTGKIIKL